MSDPLDYELDKPEPPAPEPPRDEPRRSRTPLVLLTIGGGAALGLAWFLFAGRPAPPPADPAPLADADNRLAPESALGTDTPAIDLPPLDDTDELVRRLVRELSSHPRVLAFLATDNLIRRFTVAVGNIAEGAIPRQALGALAPSGRLSASGSGRALRVDPRSYDRYNALAAAVDSIDATGAAQLFTMLRPRIEDAHAELGVSASFDRTLELAILMLLRTPVLDGDVPLAPRGGLYAFDAPSLENLTAAQKQLVRMGPRNTRIIQRKLRAIAQALGIPPERLPA